MKANNQSRLLLTIAFIDLLGFGILLPIMPFVALTMHATAFQIGCLAAAFPLFQMLLMPVWGHLADRWGPRPVLIISLAGSAFAYVLFATSTVFWGLMLSRVLAGATSATLGVVRGSLTEPNEPTTTEKNMRMFGAAQGLGFLLGPAIGAGLQLISLRAPIWAAVAICCAAIPFLMNHANLQFVPPEKSSSMRFKFMKALGHRELSRLAATYFLVYLAFAFLFISFPLFLKSAYEFGGKASAVYFSLLSVGAVFAQLVILPRLQKRGRSFGNTRILLVALGTLAIEVKLLSMPLGSGITGVILFLTSLSLFSALPILMTEIGLRSLASDKNFIAAYTESLSGLARLIGAALSGFVIEHWGLTRAFDTSAGLVTCACILVIVNERTASRVDQ